MLRHVLVLGVLLGTFGIASAESFKLGAGKYQDGHKGKCKRVQTYEWLMHIVGRGPLITCTHAGTADTMSITSGKEPPLFADVVDKSTGTWRLDDTHTLMITVDPLAHPRDTEITVGIIDRADDTECYEKWIGVGVRQTEVKP